jgi:hypothetical protein
MFRPQKISNLVFVKLSSFVFTSAGTVSSSITRICSNKSHLRLPLNFLERIRMGYHSDVYGYYSCIHPLRIYRSHFIRSRFYLPHSYNIQL